MNGLGLGWLEELKVEDGKAIAKIDGTKLKLGYNIEKVVLVVDKFGWNKHIFMRYGELGIWSFYKKIEYKPNESDLWVYVYL